MQYALIAVLGLLAFALSWRLGRRGKRAVLAGYVVLLSVLLFKAVLHQRPDWEFTLFPSPLYVAYQSWVFFPVALACLGLATGLLTGRNRRAVFALAVFVWLVSLWTERWLVLEPDISSRERADANHHCAQTTWYSCGPAASVSLLSLWGIRATEGEMMGLCRTPPYGGTSLFRIAAGLNRKLAGRPFDVRIVDGDPDALRRRGVPAIVSVKRVHVMTVRFEADRVRLLDPARGGARTIPFKDYQARYGGFAVVLVPKE
ncbi:MAG: cysteine peptidase family C39 domain-containing protein [Planctomycetota bacterium]|nr:cysteine peptidase family C39 domain-containing protein [Planctomycetota bacterium]